QHLFCCLDSGDPDLLPVEKPTVAGSLSEGLDLQAVRARIGLRQSHAAPDFSRADFRQDLLLHGLRTEPGERKRTENGIGHEQHSKATRTTPGRQLLHDQGQFEHSLTRTTVLLSYRYPGQPCVAHRLPEFVGKCLAFIVVTPIRKSEPGSDLACRFGDLILLIRKREIHGSSLFRGATSARD